MLANFFMLQSSQVYGNSPGKVDLEKMSITIEVEMLTILRLLRLEEKRREPLALGSINGKLEFLSFQQPR